MLDYFNEISIPQNKKSAFTIKNSEWRHSIDIGINICEDIDFVNLFLIVNSYLYSNLVKSCGLLTVFRDREGGMRVSQSEYMINIKGMSFHEFYDWMRFRIEND